jgi:hypothetical protein
MFAPKNPSGTGDKQGCGDPRWQIETSEWIVKKIKIKR